MDPATIATIATVIKTAVDLGPTIIKGIQDAEPFAKAIIDTLQGKTPSQDDLAQLEAHIQNLSDQLQQPLPDA